MAVALLGKCVVLSVLLFLVYVGYGFRIRDGGTEQHGTCIAGTGKCPSVDTTHPVSSTLSRRGRIDRAAGARPRLSAGGTQESAVKVEHDDGEVKRDVTSPRQVKERSRFGIRRESDDGSHEVVDDKVGRLSQDSVEVNDDDEDEENDVIIEDEDDDHDVDDESGNENEDEDDDDDDQDELSVEVDKSTKLEEEELDTDEEEEGDDTDETSIFKRIEARGLPKRDVERDERMKDVKKRMLQGQKSNKIKEDEHELNGRKVDHDLDEIKDKRTDAVVGKNEDVPPKTSVPLRKLEKVRLADKGKVRSLEVSIDKAPERESRELEDQDQGSDVEELTPKHETPVPTPKDVKTKEKKSVVQEKLANKDDKVGKQLDKTEKVTSVTEKKIEKKPLEEVQRAKTEEKMKEVKKHEKSKSKEQSASIKSQSVANSKKNSKNIKMNEKPAAREKQSETWISLCNLNAEILRLPNFVPNFTAVENPVCQQHGKIFLRQLRGYKLWALQMLDSSAKIPSGLLRGNVNQLGDFDQCLGITAHVKVNQKTVNVQGKYCLASVDLQASLADMKIPANLMQSRSFLRGTMRDPGHFVPKFTTIHWALCIPTACSARDARNAMESALSHLNVTSGMKFIVDVDPDMCYTRQRLHNYSKETIGVLYFYAMIICLVFIATLRDYIVVTHEKANYSERIIMSFSLRRTIHALTKPDRLDSNEISCINGIRSLATIALYVGHKMIPVAGMPYANRIDFTEIANNPLSSILRVSVVYTDSFLLLSGVLTAFNMSKESMSRGEIRWFCRFVGRFIRLTPPLLVVIFWYAFVMEHVGSGPQWNIIKANADQCKQNAWTNLLYIQNFFPFEEMCATHTHQLALDMQLSLLAPILVFFLQVKPIIGVLLVFFLLQVSATVRYFATTNNYLSLVIFHGMTAKHLYKTANLTYAVALHRVTPYLFGIGLGVLMHYTGKNVKIYKVFAIFGWILAILLGMWSLFSPWQMAKRDYVYDPEDAAHYAVIGPVTWALSLCWIIFACFTNHGGIVNSILSNYWLTVFSRISYSIYLTQFAVFFHNLASTRYSSEFQVHRVVDLYEILTVIGVSIVLTLFFDIPMQEVKNVLMESTDIASTINVSEDKSKSEDTEGKSSDFHERSKTPVIENATTELSRDWKQATLDNHKDSEDDERDWRPKKLNGKQRILIKRDSYDKQPEMRRREWKTEEQAAMEHDKRRSRSAQRMYDDTDRGRRPEEFRRDRRSLSRQLESSFNPTAYDADSRGSRRDRSVSRTLRKTPVMLMSSGSEDEPLQRTEKSPRRPVERPRVSDEEDWEQELRIRRRRFLERMASEEKGDSHDQVTRRSSAEGKIALLTGPTESHVMDAWTVSRGPKVSLLGSSQEPSETEEDPIVIGVYEEVHDDQRKISEPVLDEEKDFKHESRRLSTVDVTPVATGKLFKRESIVKSQASEEDPEYLLPERPKLVEQEQEHPFKKAWQMQKSRSEEDGPSAFTIKEVKTVQSSDTSQKERKSPSPPRKPSQQTFQLVVEDVDLAARQAQTDDNQANDLESSGRNDSEDKGAKERSSNGTEPPKVDWPSEDEQFDRYRRQRRESEASEQYRRQT